MISAHEHTIAEVLGDAFLHEVPPYQRPYAWKPDEALQLLDDLEAAVAASEDEPYFLGSIVLIRAPGEVVGQVVDGQQRLTTLTILAAVLRDAAENEQERSALAQAVYIEPNRFRNQVEAVRLRAHTEDRVFFREAIQAPGATLKPEPPHGWKTEAQALMWKNAMALRSRVQDMPTASREDLVTFLLNRCVLVVVSTESRTSALRVFRVLNDRGLDLSNADVIKADMLERFSEPAELAHQAARWREIENELGRQDFEALLEHLRFIRERAKSRKNLSDAYADRFRGQGVEVVRTFLDKELTPAKRWLAEIVDGDGDAFAPELRDTVVEALVGLKLLPNRDWVPTALAVAMRFGPDERTAKVLRRLEGLAWAMQLGRRYDTQRVNRYAGVLNALNHDSPAFTAALALTEKEQSTIRAALRGPLYSDFPVRVVRAILERLDRLLAEQPVQWTGQVTVEHILPQTPAAGAWTQFDAAERERVTHTLGNLVLLTKRKNSSASNAPYQQKRDVYFGLGAARGQKLATYASVQELAHVQEWTPEAYAARQARHAGLLEARWGVR